MKGIMRNKVLLSLTAVFLVCLVSFGIFNGCSSDIVLEPLPSLLGEYEGRYLVTENVGSTSQITTIYEISWRFSDQSYFLKEATPEGLCLPSGDYTLTGEVDLEEAANNNGCAGVVGNEDFNPRGVFSLRQPDDSVIMIQQIDDLKKEIRLKRIE